MTDTPYPRCPEDMDFSGLTPTSRKKMSEPEFQNFPTKPNADFPAFGLKMKENLVEHAIALNFVEAEARLSAMPEYREALVCMFGDTARAKELGDFIHKNEDFIFGCGVSKMDMVALIEQVSNRHRSHGAFVVGQAAKRLENVYRGYIYDEQPTALLHDYGFSCPMYHSPKPTVEMGRDGRPLPRHKRNVRNKVNSNRNKKRKKR